MSGLTREQRDRYADEAAMWHDLWRADSGARNARFDVTRRAELYLRVAGLQLERVLDALETDAEGWLTRLADLRAFEEANSRAWSERPHARGNPS